MRTQYHQITLKDVFSDCQDMFRDDSLSFFQILNDTIDISQLIPFHPYRLPPHHFPCLLQRIEGFLRLLQGPGRASFLTLPLFF